MFKALNIHNEIIDIENAERGNDYCCPFCKGKMIVKMGNVKIHHFAHKEKLCDDWYSENKGPWHRYMQDLFKKEYQEVILWKDNDKNSGVFHIADICIPRKNGTKTIIEFQHSPMTAEEFKIRTDFYTTGCIGKNNEKNTIIWVFDYREKYMYFDEAGNDRHYVYIPEVRFSSKDRNSRKISEFIKQCENDRLERINKLIRCGWIEISSNKYYLDYSKSLDKESFNVEWKNASKTLMNYSPNKNTKNNKNNNVRVLFHVNFRTWYTSTSEGYDSDGVPHSRSVKIFHDKEKSMTSFFIIPHKMRRNWKYFDGSVLKENVFFDWARNQ